MKIFAIRIANGFLSILPRDPLKGLAMINELNRTPLASHWHPVEFELKAFRRSGKTKPDVTVIGGGFAFRENLLRQIFPAPCEKLEFLPIRVAGEAWLITNCMKAINKYDRENSVLYRSPESDDIFLVNHIVVQDPTVDRCEIFVVDDSNRTTLLALPTFAERIERLNFGGVQFAEIGVLQLS